MNVKAEWSSFWNVTIDCLTRANDQICLENPDWTYVLLQLQRIEARRLRLIAAIDEAIGTWEC